MKGLTKPQKSKPFKLKAGTLFPTLPDAPGALGRGAVPAPTPPGWLPSPPPPPNIPPWLSSNLAILKHFLLLLYCLECGGELGFGAPVSASLGLSLPGMLSPHSPRGSRWELGAGCLCPWAPLTTTRSRRVCPREIPDLFTSTRGIGDVRTDGEDLGDTSTALPHPYLLPRVHVPSLPGLPREGFSPCSEHRLGGTPRRVWRGTGEKRDLCLVPGGAMRRHLPIARSLAHHGAAAKSSHALGWYSRAQDTGHICGSWVRTLLRTY